MIKITKGKEPIEWTEVRNTPGVTYENAPKDELRKSLLNEQGGLCAYCMRRVSFIPGTTTTTRIEHIKPRTLSIGEGREEETLSYNNNNTANGQLHAYCGVVIWYLNKKLRQMG